MSLLTRIRVRRAVLSAVLCGGLLAGAGAVVADGGNRLPVALAVPRTDVFAAAASRPADGPGLTFLLVGLDKRAGLSKAEKRRLHVGGEPCDCTDVMMLVHVSEDRERVSVISIPRDSYVSFARLDDAPPLTGTPVPAAGKINGAYKLGGPELTVRTVEEATGVRVDHYLEADFRSFVEAVDGLGGATVCTDEPMRDINSGLDLRPGTHHLDGRRSLQYVRARHIPPSGDLGRMRRQQHFLAELVDTFADRGVLDDPVALARTAGTLLTTLRADAELTTARLLVLGRALRDLDSGDTAFATVPLADFDHRVPGWGSTLVWDEDRARRLFDAVREDRPLTDEKAYALPAPGVPVAWAPSGVPVRVQGGPAVEGEARRVARALRGNGFDVRARASAAAEAPAPADASAGVPGTTEIRFRPADRRRAASLAAALPDAVLRPVRGWGRVLEVRVGRAGTRVVPVVHDRSSVQGAPAKGDTLDCDGNG
ncbi:LytR family transcriptional regulator [Streptomyces sp. RKND-216]|uniref:LCP family protein n=1 Tax=Streptomyces sp. RKND-216 TaxID=2562581 RepID=UPI00109E1CDF|nr:LCP family protein [Streptomyces sp. RKND-216]THA23622.1 LytR family transcriptional regulator [Streptomyces sp. RKND-216]